MKPMDIIYKDTMPISSRLARMTWGIVWLFLFRPTPRPLFFWRNFLLKIFGASIGPRVHVYPSTCIWAPWNLTMAEGSSLAPGVDCYCMDKVSIGAWAVISQRSYLCTASHDIHSKDFNLITAPITIEANAWVAAEAFVGPGVKVGEGAVIGARACVAKDVKPWTIVVGNPAREVSKRRLRKF
jgi:putative colanic acid biosynthesis acetyltransferase WcaF